MAKKAINNPLPKAIRKVDVKLIDLILDVDNPRFAHLTKDYNEDELLAKLAEEKNIDELIQSFQENGYYLAEPLLVIESSEKEGKYVVIEGNRRLAALRILASPNLMNRYGFKAVKINKSFEDQLLNQIPVLIYPSRDSLWSYLGFRHIKGSMPWDSYSKGLYIVDMYECYGFSLDEISTRIGDKNATIYKMFNGIRVLNQAIENNYISKEQVAGKFNFSHLYTIIEHANTKTYLGLKFSRNSMLEKNPISKNRLINLKTLFSFIYGDPDESNQPVVKVQNPDIRRLDKVLLNKKALTFLLDNRQGDGALEESFKLTVSEDFALEDTISKAYNNLQKTLENINLYKGNEFLWKKINGIKEMSTKILNKMDKIRLSK